MQVGDKVRINEQGLKVMREEWNLDVTKDSVVEGTVSWLRYEDPFFRVVNKANTEVKLDTPVKYIGGKDRFGDKKRAIRAILFWPHELEML